ncbi:MAG: AbrB/MazE/SpoVT family DNA-binding domain-containing protein [Mariprofundaceae bacterium]|nr:AbrB/MazE/SpoVT family DNA-binding domain-containing protein [Mariprofundaceae bacterium]
MLTKKTSKNQITLPKSVITHFPDVDYFDVQEEGDKIILLPVRPNQAEKVRQRLAGMGLNDQDVKDAIAWARES